MTPCPRRRLLLLGAAAGALHILASARGPGSQERLIQVRARRFTFEPEEIRLRRGVPVTLELTSLDVTMGFNLPDFGVRTDVLPGTVSRLQFTPDKTGEFPFHCDIFCGSGHENMGGVIVVS
jgi:cytochrome c oxidase subunit 2